MKRALSLFVGTGFLMGIFFTSLSHADTPDYGCQDCDPEDEWCSQPCPKGSQEVYSMPINGIKADKMAKLTSIKSEKAGPYAKGNVKINYVKKEK